VIGFVIGSDAVTVAFADGTRVAGGWVGV
jgi:hypothetical protein